MLLSRHIFSDLAWRFKPATPGSLGEHFITSTTMLHPFIKNYLLSYAKRESKGVEDELVLFTHTWMASTLQHTIQIPRGSIVCRSSVSSFPLFAQNRTLCHGSFLTWFLSLFSLILYFSLFLLVFI